MFAIINSSNGYVLGIVHTFENAKKWIENEKEIVGKYDWYDASTREIKETNNEEMAPIIEERFTCGHGVVELSDDGRICHSCNPETVEANEYADANARKILQ